MRVIVLVADEDTFTGSTHAMFRVVLLQSLQTRKHGRIFLWLAILRPECVVAERVQTYRFGLIRVEVFGERRAVEVLAGETRALSDKLLTGKSFAKLVGLL
jgi:hypothetical protein